MLQLGAFCVKVNLTHNCIAVYCQMLLYVHRLQAAARQFEPRSILQVDGPTREYCGYIALVIYYLAQSDLSAIFASILVSFGYLEHLRYALKWVICVRTRPTGGFHTMCNYTFSLRPRRCPSGVMAIYGQLFSR